MSTDEMNGECTDAKLQALRERYASIETYGVDMKNFKYWIPCREDEFFMPDMVLIRLTKDIANASRRSAEISRLRQSVKSIREAISSLSRPQIEVANLDPLFNWAKDGVSVLSECDKVIDEHDQVIRTTLSNYNSALAATRRHFEFHIRFLTCRKLFYIFCHASDRFRNKLLRESLRELKPTYILHDQMANFENTQSMLPDSKSGVGPNDALIQVLDRMYNILKSFKDANNAAAALSGANAQRAKDSMAAILANEIELHESTQSMRFVDNLISKTPPRQKGRFELSKADYLIVSGGQTGVDRAALDAARETGFRYGGWLPKGRKTEDGVLSPEYVGMKEMPTDDYLARTEQNVIDSDMTIVICHGEPEGGTKRTVEFCEKHKKPCHVINVDGGTFETLGAFHDFISTNLGACINFAGPCASKQPAIYDEAKKLIMAILEYLAT